MSLRPRVARLYDWLDKRGSDDFEPGYRASRIIYFATYLFMMAVILCVGICSDLP